MQDLLDAIRRELADRNLCVVASVTGVSYSAVRAISKGEAVRPKLADVQRLADYLRVGNGTPN